MIVNCIWGSWNQYSICSKSCGSGIQSRSRSKRVTEKYGGKCHGSSTYKRSCNTQNCPSNLNLQNISRYSALYSLVKISVNCLWGSWNQFSACSKSCGKGTQTRSRSKRVTEKYGGKCYGSSTYRRSCNTQNCPSELNLQNISRYSAPPWSSVQGVHEHP